MLKYLLDTNIVIYTIKNKAPAVRAEFNTHEGELCISTITLMELIYGAERSSKPEHNLRVVESFAAHLDVLDYDAAAAAHTGQIHAELAQAGTPIGAYDQMIAGHARSRGLAVITNNETEFARVAGLRVANWV